MKKILLSILSLFFLTICTTNVMAYSTQMLNIDEKKTMASLSGKTLLEVSPYVNSGKYVTTFSNYENNSNDTITALILDKYGLDLEFDATVNITTEITKKDEPTEGIAGTWSAAPDTLAYFIVKGANSFSLHELSPALASGSWNVTRLLQNNGRQIPALSFLRGANGISPVPEPATMFLFATGLIGIGVITRKRNKK